MNWYVLIVIQRQEIVQNQEINLMDFSVLT
jgi:hypothetical protein